MSRITHFNASPSEEYRRNTYPPNRRDYINNLPDGILGHILSRLPIKDAVRTCVLSKDWEFKWTFIYNVNILSGQLSLKWRKESRIVNIVERVLVHVQNIRNFYLTCSCRRENALGSITTLISAIFRRDIKCFVLKMFDNQDFFLPRSLLNCTSLRKLDLLFGTPCSFRVPVKNCFPNLKSLSLEGVKFLNEISDTDTLIFTFPVLKVLVLTECKWVKVKFVEIYAPSLCTFTSVAPYQWDNKKDFDYSIKFIGATISDLHISGGYPENIIMIGSTVGSAHLECLFDGSHLTHDECGLQVRKLLRELPNLKCLIITDVLWAIAQTKLGLSLPRFSELEELYINPPVDAEGLLELLNAAPFLKHLEIFLDDDWEDYDYDSVESLPSCVVHHLEKVAFNYTKCLKPNYLVEKFLLKNGAQLKNVFISDHDLLTENELVEKLSTFPKASSCLKIVGPSSVYNIRSMFFA